MACFVNLAGGQPREWKTKLNLKFHDKRNGSNEVLEEYIKQKAMIRGIMENLGDIPCAGDFRVQISRSGEYLIDGALKVYGVQMHQILENLIRTIEGASRKIADLPNNTCDLNYQISLSIFSRD